MTGKEAAQTAKNGWHFVSAKSAGIFIVVGLAGVLLGKGFDQLPDWATFTSIVGTAWGVIQWAVQSSASKVSKHVADNLPAEVAPLIVMQLTAQKEQIDEGKQDHEKCFARHGEHDRTNEELKGRVAKVEQGFERLGGAMDQVKPDWRVVG